MSFIDRYEDQLLSAAAARQREHAARRRRWRMPALGLGGLAAVAAGAAAILLIPSGNRFTPVQSALAALGSSGDLIHYRVAPILVVDGEPRPISCPTPPSEYWQATAGEQRLRVRQPTSRGEGCGPILRLADDYPILGDREYALKGRVETQYTAELNHAVVLTYDREQDVPYYGLNLAPNVFSGERSGRAGQDPQATLRQLLTSPGLRDRGVTTQAGRQVRTFVLPEAKRVDDDPDRPKDGNVTYVVDAKTFAPVSVVYTQAENAGTEQHQKWTRIGQGGRFVSWERLPLDERTAGLLELDVPADATVTRGTLDTLYRAPRSQHLEWARAGNALMRAWLEKHPGAAPVKP